MFREIKGESGEWFYGSLPKKKKRPYGSTLLKRLIKRRKNLEFAFHIACENIPAYLDKKVVPRNTRKQAHCINRAHILIEIMTYYNRKLQKLLLIYVMV